MVKLSKACKGCGNRTGAVGWKVSNVPTTLNYRYSTKQAAVSAMKGDVELCECDACGLIFNSAFDLESVSYDAGYDNRQGHSRAFLDHLDNVGDLIASELPQEGAKILEVGCGKGDFLKKLCEKFNASGTGYDTSYEGPSNVLNGLVQFKKSYISAAEVDSDYDLVICRHVVEHVDEIGEFIRELSDIAAAAGNAPLLLETPDFGWIVEESAFWDVFYEHCNYFSLDCLRSLCQMRNLVSVSHEPVFGGQYQLLLLKPTESTEVNPISPPPGGILARFVERASRSKTAVFQMVEDLTTSKNWAIWGSGAKGVTFTHYFEHHQPSCLIDINPEKQGGFTPGSGVPILSPEDAIEQGVEVIFCANPNYESEIRTLLDQLGFSGMVKSF